MIPLSRPIMPDDKVFFHGFALNKQSAVEPCIRQFDMPRLEGKRAHVGEYDPAAKKWFVKIAPQKKKA